MKSINRAARRDCNKVAKTRCLCGEGGILRVRCPCFHPLTDGTTIHPSRISSVNIVFHSSNMFTSTTCTSPPTSRYTDRKHQHHHHQHRHNESLSWRHHQHLIAHDTRDKRGSREWAYYTYYNNVIVHRTSLASASPNACCSGNVKPGHTSI